MQYRCGDQQACCQNHTPGMPPVKVEDLLQHRAWSCNLRQVLGAASARLNAALQQCAPEAGIELSVQQQALDTAIYFLECSAAAVADSLVPPADASPRKAALQPGAAYCCLGTPGNRSRNLFSEHRSMDLCPLHGSPGSSMSRNGTGALALQGTELRS